MFNWIWPKKDLSEPIKVYDFKIMTCAEGFWIRFLWNNQHWDVTLSSRNVYFDLPDDQMKYFLFKGGKVLEVHMSTKDYRKL